ncbi:MAG: CtsR family transcriptional regulator [Clostridia bacterium]|nr:CtsR family transcriptional regulator [Clostridia bacterium]
MRMSDAIAAYILHMMETSSDGSAELQRNELAGEIGCVPSQINYVLSSRFTPQQGYLVESRRGGGGYIRVSRIRLAPEVSMLTHVVNSIGDTLVASAAQAIVQNLFDGGFLTEQAARTIAAAVSDRAYHQIPVGQRDRVRADMMKYMLTAATMS